MPLYLTSPPVSSLVATGAASISTNGSTISFGANNQTLSVWEPMPITSSSAGTAYSSHAPASIWFNRVVLPDPVAISNINVLKSFAVGVPAATSVNSTGTLRYSYSHGITVFSRQNYGTGSTNLTTVTTASFGLTAGLTYSTSSQSFAYSWVTNTTGGTTSQSTTSSNAAWSNSLNQIKMIQIPMLTTLGVGEYFFAHQHSSTTGTTGASNITILSASNLHQVPPSSGSLTYAHITASASANWSHITGGVGFGVASAVTTTTTMGASVISVATQNIWYMNFSNA